MDEHRRVIEQVQRWYHETEIGVKATNEVALSTLGSSYRIQMVPLNFALSETSLSTFLSSLLSLTPNKYPVINENSTFRQVGLQLYSPDRPTLPVALEHICGPFPQWRVPHVDARVPRSLQKIYVVDINEPFTLALVRGIEGDSPLLLREPVYIRPVI
jgi:hypothetical protein